MKPIGILKLALNRDKIILGQARRNKEIVYGGQAMNRQTYGFLNRTTYDYDIYSRKPKKSAKQLEREFDRTSGYDSHYVKEAMHRGTYKVMNRGRNLEDPRDDFNEADYTRPTRRIKKKRINGVFYAALSETRKDKLQSLRDPKFKFRHRKDKEDLNIIDANKKLRRSPFI